MKILFLSNSFGSLANFRFELITELVQKGHEVYLCFPFGENTEKLKHLNCKYINVHLSRKGTNVFEEIKTFVSIFHILKKVRPGIIYSYTIKPNIYGGIAANILNIPIVQSITGFGSAMEKIGVRRSILTFLYRAACTRSQRVMCQNSEILKYFFEHHIGSDKLCLVSGSGVNLEYFKYLDYPKASAIDFFLIARICKEKGIDQYIAIAKEIRKTHVEAIFHVVGKCEDPKYENILDQLQKEGILLYHGEQTEMLEIQRKNACTIHPTYYPEGMSNILLESAACGRPVITTNRSGCREAVDDYISGFVCNVKDTEDMIEKVNLFLNFTWEKKRDMGMAGRRKMVNEFDRKEVVKKYIEELEHIK